MIEGLIKSKLEELKDSSLLVVMDDGVTFGGTLSEFDKHVMVLKHVYQASSTTINWKDMEGEQEKEKPPEIYGFIEWTQIRLKEVYLDYDHVSRIWPWVKITERYPVEEVHGKGPVYRAGPLRINRMTGLDIPEMPDNPLR